MKLFISSALAQDELKLPHCLVSFLLVEIGETLVILHPPEQVGNLLIVRRC
jgi:hypothetical protein